MAYRDDVLALSPTAYWRLGESSGTAAADETGTHAGTYENSPTLGVTGLLTGDANTAVDFNGSTHYVTIPAASLPAGNTATVILWTKDITASNSSVFGWKDATTWDQFQCHLPYGDNVVYFDTGAINSTTKDRISKAIGGLDLAAVHFWAFVKNATTGDQQIYLDGELWHSATGMTRVLATSTMAQIARNTGVSYMNATLDEVAVFSTALTGPQIAALYASGTGAATGPTPSSLDIVIR